MLFRLLLLFILVPFVELTLLLALGDLTNWWVALLIVVVTGVAGSLLARRQGWQAYQRIRSELSRGLMPADVLLDALMIFVAGALLVTPGLLTDAVGLSLLVPYTRGFYKRRLIHWFRARFFVSGLRSREVDQDNRSQVIDSYVVDKSIEAPKPPERD